AVADNEELNLNRYIILIKRSTEPIDDAISKIIELTMHRRGEEIGVNVECSSYLNGRYDWMFVLTAEDIKSVKKFSDILTKEYHSVISDIHIMEDIFSVKKCGMVNPHMEKLREFI
ncbi:MAG: Lrp/AsnC family transcriptional regulator, partial [Thermoplasmatales archaeon]|nr:Lrp/AsnC family transcriptional regulator [Thermoplasmatales archaeon]